MLSSLLALEMVQVIDQRSHWEVVQNQGIQSVFEKGFEESRQSRSQSLHYQSQNSGWERSMLQLGKLANFHHVLGSDLERGCVWEGGSGH